MFLLTIVQVQPTRTGKLGTPAGGRLCEPQRVEPLDVARGRLWWCRKRHGNQRPHETPGGAVLMHRCKGKGEARLIGFLRKILSYTCEY